MQLVNRESLILKEQAELESAPFFPDFDLPEIDRTKPKFNFTGDRLFRDRPDVYKAVVLLLAEPGVTVRTICRELHVTDDTVRAVKARENISIAAEKKTVLSNITHGLRLASERVIELMPTASTRDSLIGVGILGEKMQLLGGDATMRIDIGPRVNLGDNVSRMHREAVKAYADYKAAIANGADPEEARLLMRVNVTKAIADCRIDNTGLEPENSEQKALTNGIEPQSAMKAVSSAPAVLQEAAI